MSKVNVIPAKTETKVIEVEPKRYTLELSEDEALYLARLGHRFAGYSSTLYQILRPLSQKFDGPQLTAFTSNDPEIQVYYPGERGKVVYRRSSYDSPAIIK